MKVLIVDDNETDRRALRFNLARLGHEVTEATGGQEGREMALGHSPDLIVSAIPMAAMEGFHFLRRLKADEALRAIPVIAYSSASATLEDREFALSLGADSFIVKPEDPQEFRNELGIILEGPPAPQPRGGEPLSDAEYWKKYGTLAAARMEEKEQEIGKERSLRLLAEESCRKNEEHYRALFETSPDAVLIMDMDFAVLDANYAAFSLFRYDSLREMKGRNIIDFIVPEERPRAVLEIRTFIEKGYVDDLEHNLLKGDGSSFFGWIRASLIKDSQRMPYAVMISLRDTSGKRMVELHLQQSRKMEALESLAGGISAEFGSLIEQITAIALPLRRDLKDSPLLPHAEGIIAAAERSSSIIRQLLLFSRRERVAMEPVDLNEVIKNSVMLLEGIFPETVRVRFVPFSKDLMVMADTEQISRMLMNIATLSRDAMPEGGSLAITTNLMEMDDSFIRSRGYGKLWKYALITLTDTGRGMDEQGRERIFEPYFTAERNGKVEGLSLSVAYGIVKELKGYIDVSSGQGKGTTFSIYLPLIKPGR
ncbi:MAG: response regulator [Thermodesulfovibrionales bacterium]